MNKDKTLYIANMLAQMARMITARDRPLLVYLIEMAAIEAGAARQPVAKQKRTDAPQV